VGRDGHDGPFSVTHEHVVAYPHFHLFAGEGVLDEDARGHALLFHGGDVRLGHASLFAFFNEGGQFRIVLGGPGGQGVFGGHGHEGDPHQGVGPGGENPQLVGFTVQLVGEGQAHAGALADPVFLHQAYLLGPAFQLIQICQQFFGVGGDLHVIHGDFPLFHQGAGTPAPAVDDLFVGQHGLVHRVPVHRAQALVDQALFKEPGEQPLFPAVVVRLAGGDFPFPVDGEAQALELAAHVIDIGVGPLGGGPLVLDGGVFRRHAESVPAHGLEHVEALHLVKAGKHVADGVVAHVAHVQLPGGIGEHGQAVVLGLGEVCHGPGGLGLNPVLLGGGFHGGGLIFFLHGVGPE